MTLVPVTGIVAVVAKLERENPAAARELVRQGLYESLCDQVEALRGDLEPALLREMAVVTKRARATVTRTAVSKALATGELHGTEEIAALDAIDAFIEKSLIGNLLQAFNRSHPRDDRGRFVRVDVKGYGSDAKSRRDSSHLRAADTVQRMHDNGLVGPTTPIGVHVETVSVDGKVLGPEERTETTPEKLAEHLTGMDPRDKVTGVSVARRDLPTARDPKAQTGLDIVGMLTGKDALGSQGMINRATAAAASAGGAGGIAGDWYGSSQGGEKQDRQGYRRLKLTGQALTALNAPGSAGSAAGGLAQLVGELGPEAEKVLAPGIRRAAYRYRGTEQRPDKHLVSQVKTAEKWAADNRVSYSEKPAENPAVQIGRHYSGVHSKDRRAMLTSGDATVAWMLGLGGAKSQVPERDLAELSVASGEVPPSRGVIIDADGDLVSQAVGFNGDHYLPFDLRNLNSLHGGQYVRTRALGGPTGEDLFASVMLDARQAQVVSNSGVFTLEFDPDMRGGRRYSDKARRMVQRYNEILETIAGPNKLYERDLSPQTKTDLRRRAATAADGDEAEFTRILNDLTAKERIKGSMASDEDDEAAMEAAGHQAQTRIRQEMAASPDGYRPSPQERKRMLREYTDEAYAELTGGSVKPLSLNGAGYDRALRALKQEFPQFIRSAKWQALPDWLRERELANPKALSRVGATDTGYVEPGQTNPAIGRRDRNARRLVPTSRGAAVAAAAAGGNAAATTADTAPSTGSTPREASVPAPKKSDYDIAALTREGSKLFYPLTKPAAVLAAAAVRMPAADPFEGDPADLPHVADDHAYIVALSQHLTRRAQPGRTGQTFTQWYFNEATDAERAKVAKGWKILEEEAAGDAYLTQVADPIKLREAMDEFEDAADLVLPFASVPEGDEPAMSFLAGPEIDRPKPVSPEALGLKITVGATPEEFQNAKDQLVALEPSIEAMLQAMSGESDEQRAEDVLGYRDRYLAEPDNKAVLGHLTRIHQVWSLLRAEETTAKLANLGVGGADPKVGKALRPRRVIVHKLDDPFTRRTLASLGIS